MSEKQRAAQRDSDFVLAARYLKSVACPACGGMGWKAGGKDCTFCRTTGFKSGETYLLVSAAQRRTR